MTPSRFTVLQLAVVCVLCLILKMFYQIGFEHGLQSVANESSAKSVEIANCRQKYCTEERIGGGYRNGKFVYLSKQ